PLTNRFAIDEKHAADKGEVFPCGKVIEQRQILRYDANTPFRLERLLRILHVLTENANLPVGRSQKSREHFDSRGLPCAIRSEKSIKRTALHPQIDSIDGAKIAKESR